MHSQKPKNPRFPMKQLGYNFKVAHAIKAMRKLRGLTQNQVADALCIERSVYSKLENGETAIVVDYLKLISDVLATSVFQILVIAEADILINFKLTSLSDILIRYTLLMEGRTAELTLSDDELKFIITKVKSFYEST
jgi:transcriptional regulator with XRE-family HTH domain